MYKILLIGAGHLGRRYIEGILRTNHSLTLHVVDKSTSAINEAKKIIVPYEKEINFSQDLPNKTSFDLIIIATTATNRSDLIEKLNLKYDPNHWIIEKVLEQSVSNLEKINQILRNKNAYVNTPRRINGLYNCTKYPTKNLKFTVEMHDFGIACNAIHFIDVVEYLSGQKILNIDTSGLDDFWIQSKRIGYLDVYGTLNVEFEKNVNLTITSLKTKCPVKMEIESEDVKYQIYENDKYFLKNGKKIFGDFMYLSEITPLIINQLIKENVCSLTKLSTSIRQHKILISSLLKHYNRNNSEKELRIT